MNIKLSKSQWEKIGNEAGWMRKEAAQPGKKLMDIPAKIEVWSGTGQGFRFQVNFDNGKRQTWIENNEQLQPDLEDFMEINYPNLKQRQYLK